MLTVAGDYAAVRFRVIISRMKIVIGIRKFYSVDVKRFVAFSFEVKIFHVSFYGQVFSAIICANDFIIHIKLKYKSNRREKEYKQCPAKAEYPDKY